MPESSPDGTAQAELQSLGLMSSQTWQLDPKRLTFVLARYKFVAKMFDGLGHVLEIGCADAFGTKIVCQHVGWVTAIDRDREFIQDAQTRMNGRWAFTCHIHDILTGPFPYETFDAAYALDVLEHISAQDESTFMQNAAASLKPHGVLILGTPSLESQQYASPISRAAHVNCKTGPELKLLAARYFENVFLFSMNDEIVHTGFSPMAHYLLVLCCGRLL